MTHKEYRAHLQAHLEDIGNLYGEAVSVTDAKIKKVDTFITLNYSGHMGGYRLERVRVVDHSVTSHCFGMNCRDPRIKAKEMDMYLLGLIHGKVEDKR